MNTDRGVRGGPTAAPTGRRTTDRCPPVRRAWARQGKPVTIRFDRGATTVPTPEI